MNTLTEPAWKADVVPLVQYCKATVTDRPIVCSSLLAMAIVVVVLPSFSNPSGLIESVLRAYLGFALVLRIWNDQAEQGEKVAPRKTPWVRLVLLEGIYFWTVLIFSMFLIAPGVWWGVCSSLSYVLVCLEDCSLTASFGKSFRMVKEHFWFAAKYLLPMNLMIVLPTGLLAGWVRSFSEEAHKHVDISALLLITISVFAVITTALTLLAWLTSLGLLVRLYAYIKKIPAAN